MAINPDKFVFHTKYTPLSVPKRIDLSVKSGTSIGASARARYYSPWVDIGFDNGAPDVYYETPDGKVRKTFTTWNPRAGQQPLISMYTQMNDQNQIRVMMEVSNTETYSITYPETTIKAYVHIFLLAPPQ